DTGLSDTEPYVSALCGASLMAVHVGQVIPSRTARMYSMAVLLAAITAWLLLRALRSSTHRHLWWSGYGIAVAASCYTHHYALLTVCAQLLFVITHMVVGIWRGSLQSVKRLAAGILLAGFIGSVLYAPWLPSLLIQVHDVRDSFW